MKNSNNNNNNNNNDGNNKVGSKQPMALLLVCDTNQLCTHYLTPWTYKHANEKV